MGLALLGVAILTFVSLVSGCADEELDKEYLMVFMDTNITSSQVEVISASPDPTIVTITTPSLTSGPASLDITQNLEANKASTNRIDGNFKLSREGLISGKVLSVKSDRGFVAYGQNVGRAGCESFMPISPTRLGREYYIVGHYPPSVAAVAAVAAGSQGARVAVYALASRINPLQVNGQQVKRGERFIFDLGAYQTIQITSLETFSGTRILSDKPIAVFSGNVNVNVNAYGSDITGQVVEQLVPFSQWHTEHVVVPFPDRPIINLKFVSPTYTDVKVYLGNSLVRTITLTPDIRHQIFWRESNFYTIVSTAPIQVVQIANSKEGQPPSLPAMTIVPPTTAYRREYYFAFPEDSGATGMVLVSIREDRLSGLLLDGNQISQLGWSRFGQTSPRLVGKQLNINGGSHNLKHPDTPFGAVLYGHKGECSYAMPAGLCIPKNPDAGLSAAFPTAAPAPPPLLTPKPTTQTTTKSSDYTTTSNKKAASSYSDKAKLDFMCIAVTSLILVHTIT